MSTESTKGAKKGSSSVGKPAAPAKKKATAAATTKSPRPAKKRPATPKTKVFRQAIELPAPPAAVYAALVDPKKHAAFTGAKATGAARVGGRFSSWDGYIVGEYVELSPNERIVARWSTTEWPEGAEPSLVDFKLEAIGKHTLVTLIHGDVPASQAARYADGWVKFYWEPLARYFGG